jgi:YHS domain-containing protein
VALKEKGVLWPGDPECSAKYREKIYYLSNDEAREKFLANPAAFVPADKPFAVCILGVSSFHTFDFHQ